ncbi:MAG TPA: acetylxylan esterase [Verrucomicrobiota bacterium]|nr:acetylxylan esterase [Verrucomicrobiota bacterium]HNT14282.1 acetylxylan esterase [Verrucomicrobiota bacterium]
MNRLAISSPYEKPAPPPQRETAGRHKTRTPSRQRAGRIGLGICVITASLCAAPPDVLQEESRVPSYTLPDPLVSTDGSRVTTAGQWLRQRRPELLRLFAENVYGVAPSGPARCRFETTSQVTNALHGLAIRKEVTVWLTGDTNGPGLELLIYIPNPPRAPVPAFLGLNFAGNHAITTEPDVKLSTRWMREAGNGCVTHHRATAACRGSQAARWPLELILRRGYGLVTAYYGDLEADFPTGWQLGGRESLRAALHPDGTNAAFLPTEWGAISAWAWGLSRALDYLETDPAVDARRVIVMGHSRLGKTALWAGASDPRFAAVISNNSGEGGAAIMRRRFGERILHLNRNFPHWFCGRFKDFSERENALPVDAHELIALLAPRPVYVTSATEDHWADPRGEFLAAQNAEPVYALFGKPGLGVAAQPAPDQPVGDFIAYHLRSGPHDVTEYDWRQWLQFADRHFLR